MVTKELTWWHAETQNPCTPIPPCCFVTVSRLTLSQRPAQSHYAIIGSGCLQEDLDMAKAELNCQTENKDEAKQWPKT